jgi:hypothetical protein
MRRSRRFAGSVMKTGCADQRGHRHDCSPSFPQRGCLGACTVKNKTVANLGAANSGAGKPGF